MSDIFHWLFFNVTFSDSLDFRKCLYFYLPFWRYFWLAVEFQIQINFTSKPDAKSDVSLNLISSYVTGFFFFILEEYMIFLFTL